MEDTILIYNQLKELGIIQDTEYLQNFSGDDFYKIEKKIEMLFDEKEILDIKTKKNSIMINFTGLFDKGAKSNKEYQEICFHTPNT